jgi:alpha-glucosidase
MRNAVLGMLAGGVSGALLWHSDIGCTTSLSVGVKNFIRPPRLKAARWAQMQAFGVVMRTHERPRLKQQAYDTPQTRCQQRRCDVPARAGAGRFTGQMYSG